MSEERKYHLAVDIGSDSGRAIVGWIEDGRLKTEQIHRFVTQIMYIRGHYYRNIYRYFDEIVNSLKIFAEKYGDNLASIGVDSWGSTCVLIDKNGGIISMPRHFIDRNGPDWNAVIEKNIGRYEVYRRTGGYESSGDTLQTLMYIMHEYPGCDPQGMLFMGDVYQYLLGADACCEESLATYGRIFNTDTDEWDDEILTAAGIPLGVKTRVSKAGETVGHIFPELLKEAGLTGPVPIVTPSIHDTACAVLAIPDMGNDWAFISSGTWSLPGILTAKPVKSETAWKYNFSNSYVPFGKNMLKVLLAGAWGAQRCKNFWKKYSYPEIDRYVEASEDRNLFVDLDDKELFFENDLPLAIQKRIHDAFGAEIDPYDVGTVGRIVFESTALKYKVTFDRLLEETGKKVKKIYIVGGGSKNKLLNQFTANVMDLDTYTGIDEGSSAGNLLMQMYGCGELKSESEIRKVSENTFPKVVYKPKDQAIWKNKLAIFKDKALTT